MSPESFKEVTPGYSEDVLPSLEELINTGAIDASASYVMSIHDEEARRKIETVVREYAAVSPTEKAAAKKKAGAAIDKIIDSI
jgi:hypothetical protein